MQNLLIALGGIVVGIIIVIAFGHYLIYKRKKAIKKNAEIAIYEWRKAFDVGFYRQPYDRIKPTGNLSVNILEKLRVLNPERCKAFGHSVDAMPLTFWATAVAGESGELCNIIKKIERGDKIANARDEIGKEAADVVIYLDLLCTKIGIRLEDYIKLKFNEVSDRVKSPIKL